MSDAVLHPKCGTTFTNNDTVGHCAACCHTFYGLRAFDKHRRGGFCNELADGARGFWLDKQGRWHWGERWDAAAKARIVKNAEA